jgi:hypothetical protein
MHAGEWKSLVADPGESSMQGSLQEQARAMKSGFDRSRLDV